MLYNDVKLPHILVKFNELIRQRGYAIINKIEQTEKLAHNAKTT